MAKRVQLVLNQDISKLGKFGDLVDVAPGYARNYLIPKKLATPATPGILKQVERKKEAERQRQAELKQQSIEQKATLENITSYSIPMQVGENGAIFGAVTTQDITDIIKQVAGLEIDKRSISLPDIGALGTYEAELKLHPEVSAKINLSVVAK
jgi:large subunit ribosomal protein L9